MFGSKGPSMNTSSLNLAQISAAGGKREHRTQDTYTVQTFSWPLLSFAAESSASGPQSGKAPYHSPPLPHLFYLHISDLSFKNSTPPQLTSAQWSLFRLLKKKEEIGTFC
jgi:hypothetical protein